MRPATVSGIVAGNALVRCWSIFFKSLVTVPNVFAKDFKGMVSTNPLLT